MMAAQTRLFVGSLPSGATEDNLKDTFSKYGDVSRCEIKSKSGDLSSRFAFITLTAQQNAIEECLNNFSNKDWNGSRLYVTKARESFLERLQKERQQSQIPKQEEVNHSTSNDYDDTFKIKKPQQTKFNIPKPGERKENKKNGFKDKKKGENKIKNFKLVDTQPSIENFEDKKKITSDNKRLEAMRKMREQFNEKKRLLKFGLAGVDAKSNKKIKFETEDETSHREVSHTHNGTSTRPLFDNDDDDDDSGLNFDVKKQFEGKKGQKVLELQSRFKSDKRFTLDERFVDDESDGEIEKDGESRTEREEEVEMAATDEKARQLVILQDVLGVAIKSRHTEPQASDSKKLKTTFGMVRFDPNKPEHSKFLAPNVDLSKEEGIKKKKKKKTEETQEREIEKVEVSTEQFYTVSDSLKESIAQPNTFSLRSLFGQNQEEQIEDQEQETGFIPLLNTKKDKVKNPFDTSDKNPFKYDSSDSEPEAEDDKEENPTETTAEDVKIKAVWREKFFFTKFDNRFKEGLSFFNTIPSSGNKERRELKSLVKKRFNNHARKDQMFKKKIGGKRRNFSNKMKQKR